MLLAEFGTGQVFWSMLWFFLWFIWIWMLIVVFGDIFRSPDLSGWGKALWTIFVIFLPYLGVFVYLIARGRKMQEHAVQAAQAQDAAMRAVRPERRRQQRWRRCRRALQIRPAPRSGRPQRGRVPTGQGEGAVLTDASVAGRAHPDVRLETSAARAHAGRSSGPRPTSCVSSSPPRCCSSSSSSSGCSGTRWSASHRISSVGSTPFRRWIVDAIVVGTRVLAVVVLGGLARLGAVRAAVADARHRRPRRAAWPPPSSRRSSPGSTPTRRRARRGRPRSRSADHGIRVPVDRRHRRGRRGAHRRRAVARPSGAPGRMGADAGPAW